MNILPVGIEELQKNDYDLIISTYPRSGVNFLSNMIKESTNLNFCYTHKTPLNKKDNIITIIRNPKDSIVSWVSMGLYFDEIENKYKEENIDEYIRAAIRKYITFYEYAIKNNNYIIIFDKLISRPNVELMSIANKFNIKFINEIKIPDVIDDEDHGRLVSSKKTFYYEKINEVIYNYDLSRCNELYEILYDKSVRENIHDSIRIMVGQKFFNEESGFNQNSAHIQAFHFSASKIGTNDPILGKSDWEVVDVLPVRDAIVCTVLIPEESIIVKFNTIKNHLFFGDRNSTYKVDRGDMLAFINTNPYKITDVDGVEREDLKYRKELFSVVRKKTKGNGKYKFKGTLIFSDTYEYEVYADNEEEARKIIENTDTCYWDHIYNISLKDINQYNSQLVRYSLWKPSQIKITRES